MKTKEILIIFVLAALVTGGSWFWTKSWSSGAGSYFSRGFPLAFYEEMLSPQHGSKEVFNELSLFLNFLFWTLVIILIFFLRRASFWFYRKTGKSGLCFVGGFILLLGGFWGMYRFPICRNLEACTIPYFREDPCKLLGREEPSAFCQRSVEEIKKDISGKPLPSSLQEKLQEGIEFGLLPTTGLAGGDILTVPIIVVKNGFLPNVYCRATEKNYARLFSPLTHKEVLDYLDFRLHKLSGSAYGRTGSPICSMKEFKSVPCPANPEKEGVDADFCRVEEKAGDYIVNWVYYTTAGRTGIYRQKLRVGKDARIEPLGEVEEILYCGPGIMF